MMDTTISIDVTYVAVGLAAFFLTAQHIMFIIVAVLAVRAFAKGEQLVADGADKYVAEASVFEDFKKTGIVSTASGYATNTVRGTQLMLACACLVSVLFIMLVAISEALGIVSQFKWWLVTAYALFMLTGLFPAMDVTGERRKWNVFLFFRVPLVFSATLHTVGVLAFLIIPPAIFMRINYGSPATFAGHPYRQTWIAVFSTISLVFTLCFMLILCVTQYFEWAKRVFSTTVFMRIVSFVIELIVLPLAAGVYLAVHLTTIETRLENTS
eukprot:m.147576 g.147576  ORF g.147576 m.147576 type:complete len:269 (-) comp16117_c4_seq3:146-952(-)